MTRGRDRNIAWIPDPTGALEPEGAFNNAIARPSSALTAHATRDHLHRLRHEPVGQPPVGLHVERGAALEL